MLEAAAKQVGVTAEAVISLDVANLSNLLVNSSAAAALRARDCPGVIPELAAWSSVWEALESPAMTICGDLRSGLLQKKKELSGFLPRLQQSISGLPGESFEVFS